MTTTSMTGHAAAVPSDAFADLPQAAAPADGTLAAPRDDDAVGTLPTILVITGDAGDNVLDGRGETVIMAGLGGNDTYFVDEAADVVDEAVGEGIDRVLTSVDYALKAGQAIERLATAAIAGTTPINLTGNEFAQTIVGNAGHNVIDGGGGADVMRGLGGDDTYIVDDAGDQVFEAAGGGIDQVAAGVSYGLKAGQAIEAMSAFVGFAAINLTGNEFSQTIFGNEGDNVIDGKGAADTMAGFGGNDFYFVDNAADVVLEAAGGGTIDQVLTSVSYVLGAGQEIEVLATDDISSTAALRLSGNALAQQIVGNNGANTIDGKGGADMMIGNGGDDTYIVNDAGAQAFELDGEGSDRVLTGVDYALGAGQSIELLATTDDSGTAAIRLTGNDLAQTIVGNAGNNVIDGGGGADIMRGGDGSDRYLVDNAGDRVIEAPRGAVDLLSTDAVLTSVSYALAAGQSIEVLAAADAAGTEALRLTGNAFAQFLSGNAGDNTLNGGGGADVMAGGDGNDTYIVDNAGDTIFERTGTDRVVARVSYGLGDGQEIELLTTSSSTGTAAINLTGNEFAQTIIGNAGANILDGKGGADVLRGLGGNDTYVVDDRFDLIDEAAGGGTDTVSTSVDYTLGAGQEIERLATADAAGHAGLLLTGNEFAQTIVGNAGANILDGKGGADTLSGLGGNDGYFVDNAADVVNEAAGGGVDEVTTTVSYALKAGQEIEVMRALDGSPALPPAIVSLTGNEFGQVMLGNDAGSVIDGKGGADAMVGHRGDDTYLVDNAGDSVFENAGEGTDRVLTSVSYALGAGQSIEAFATTDSTGTAAIRLTGNGASQTITGNAGANVIDGLGGADTMRGLGGDDTYIVDNAGDLVGEAANAGADRVLTSVSYALSFGQSIELLATTDSAGAIDLTGNAFAQTIVGNAGSNVIAGGGGNDTLTGLGGSDTFVFDTAVNGATNVDRISDFSVTDDSIGLEASIFTALTTAGVLSAGAFFTGPAAHDADDRIIYNAATGTLSYDADGTGATAAIRFATVETGLALTHLDFLVL